MSRPPPTESGAIGMEQRLRAPYDRLKKHATKPAKRGMKCGARVRRRDAANAGASSAAGDGTRRIGDPLAPGPRVQTRAGELGDTHGENVVTRRHAGSALVHDGRGESRTKQRLVLRAQLCRGLERAVLGHVCRVWAVSRAGNVAGDRIDQLHVSAVTLGSACVEHEQRVTAEV